MEIFFDSSKKGGSQMEGSTSDQKRQQKDGGMTPKPDNKLPPVYIHYSIYQWQFCAREIRDWKSPMEAPLLCPPHLNLIVGVDERTEKNTSCCSCCCCHCCWPTPINMPCHLELSTPATAPAHVSHHFKCAHHSNLTFMMVQLQEKKRKNWRRRERGRRLPLLCAS